MSSTGHPHQSPIAVIGVSALFPGSTDAAGFWRDILAGRDLITDVPASHWLIEDYYDPDPSAPDKTYCKRGAFLGPVDFDPMEFGVPPNIVPATDTAQILALIVAQKVLEDASKGQFATMNRERMSVILGVTSAQELLSAMVSRLQRPVWTKALRESGIPEAEVGAICDRIAGNYTGWQESSFPGLLGNVVAGRIANRFDLRGTNCVTDAACASTLSALSMAVNELTLGQADVVIAGGVDTMNDIFMYMCFSKTPALSRTGDCRPFSDAADGTMMGEGMAMFALKRLEDAERDHDRIYGVIRGLGSASDGRSKSVYAPLPEGQARAVRRAYESAGFGPDTVELLEAHGTGTFAGDAAEFEGLRMSFGEAGREDKQWCALGSVKSQIGHTKAAAGAAGMFKALMALHHKVLPPTIKVDRPNPKLEIDQSPFYLNTVARPWIHGDKTPRRAGVSAFGFGGSNFHVVLEEHTPAAARSAPRFRTSPAELVVLSAATPAALAARCRELAAQKPELVRTARETQAAFRATDAARLAIVANTPADLAAKLEQAAGLVTGPEASFSTPTGIHFASGGDAGRVAFVFPGQGSQYVGMGADLAIELDVARRVWDASADHRFDGVAVHEVVFPRPVFSDAEREAQAKLLTATEWAQPAIGLTSLALLEVLRAVGIKPVAACGHSFGEVTALCAAGALDEDRLLDIARKRGEIVRDAASEPGAMTAVQATRAQVDALLAKAGLDVAVANHNGPTQVVLAGTVEAIDAIEKQLAAAGLIANRLQVAAAFHSKLVAGARAPFREFLESVAVDTPAIDVFGNADADAYPRDAAAIRERMAVQLVQPVRFVEEIEAMYAAGVRTFVEVGPGSAMTALVGKILAGKPHLAVNLDRKGKHGLVSLFEGLGRLAVAGIAIDFAALWAEHAPLDDKPRKKPAMVMPISGTNYGKLYPPKGGAAALPKPNPPRPVAPPVVAKAPAPAVHANGTAHHPPSGGANGSAAPVANGVTAAPRPAIAASPAPAFEGSDVQLAWVKAYQETQRQTVEAHAAHQRAMAESHGAFLRMTETSFSALGALLGGQPMAPSAPAVHLPEIPRPSPVAQTWAAPEAVHAEANGVAIARAPQPVRAPAPPAPKVVAPAPAPAPAAPAQDLEALMLAVVADKTGYPTEMLKMEMQLEADLGIDSIKRVEILSALRERAPNLPAVKPTELATLRSLGQIVDYLRAAIGASAPPPAAPSVAAPPAAPAQDLEALMLAVVADKTGYPTEMLKMEMQLEADLGIDSIKRVEILSALRERAPNLPAVKPTELATLRSLGQIVDYLRAAIGATAPVAAPAAPIAPTAPAQDLEALMLAVVADKTGYPTEMLKMEMQLEADLGIDSIKRVEILSALRERAPDLPAVKPTELAALRSLGQIVDYLRARTGGSAAPAAAEAPMLAAAPAPVAIERSVVRAVPAPASGMGLAGLASAGRVVVTDEGTGVAAEVVRELAARGVRAEVVASVPADAGAVVFLGGLRPVASVDEAVAVNREAFHAAKAVAARMTAEGGVFVGVQDTGGDFGLSGAEGARAWLGGVAALARTTAQEWPKASVKAIDCARGLRAPEVIAAAIVEELFAGGSTLDVGLRADGTRLGLRRVAEEPVTARRPIDDDAVIVASGGARGVTAATLVALARARKPRIALLGRTKLVDEPAIYRGLAEEPALKRAAMEEARRRGKAATPAEVGAEVARVLANREVHATIAALKAAGSDVCYVAADMADAAAVSAALDQVRIAWGPITGLVHGAGVIVDRPLTEKTDEQFDRVFDTKIEGLRALLAATARDPLSVICLFSSVAGHFGNPGQSDYAMANEVLNLVACAERARRGDACIVRSIGWGPWDGGMVKPAHKALFAQLGIPLIPLDVGASVLVEEVEDASPHVELIVGGPPRGKAPPTHPSVEIRVAEGSYPYLADHTVAGHPVVPVALALDWFARAARDLQPAEGTLALRDVKVLRGIRLDHFRNGGDSLSMLPRSADGAVELELRGAREALHYRAVVETGSIAAPVKLARPALPPPRSDVIYDGHMLFHGPRFQVIQSIDGLSRDGAAATLQGGRDRGFEPDHHRVDPALADGALQLAVVWAREVLGGASLPMGVDRFTLHSPGLQSGPLTGVVRPRKAQESRATCDVVIAGADGIPVLELTGVTLVRRPDDEPSNAGR